MTSASSDNDECAAGQAGAQEAAVTARGAMSSARSGEGGPWFEARVVRRWQVRAFDPVSDAAAIVRLDTSYVCDRVYTVLRDGDVIALAPAVTAARVERASVAPVDWGALDGGMVALDGTVRGAIGWTFDAARREMTIRVLQVDRVCRRRGAARALLAAALVSARQTGAVTARLTIAGTNAPAIAACCRLGFAICGFDAAPAPGAGRGDVAVAVFLVRRIDGHD